MMNEERALQSLDEELHAALAGLSAPPHFDAAVRRRIEAQRVSPLPEILDAIGWTAVLAILFALLIWLSPMVMQSALWQTALGGLILMAALCFALRGSAGFSR